MARRGRAGNAARRALEFAAVVRQVKRNKERFIARLTARIEPTAEGCLVYRATMVDGYPKITFRLNGHHITMKVHRVFGILMNKAPIPVGFDVGHEPHCKSRACVRHLFLQPYAENALTDPRGDHFNRR